MNCPTGVGIGKLLVNVAKPLAAVVMLAEPSSVSPSPLADEAQDSFAKNCNVDVALGLRSRLPMIVVFPALEAAALKSGKFCKPFGAESPSPGSFKGMP